MKKNSKTLITIITGILTLTIVGVILFFALNNPPPSPPPPSPPGPPKIKYSCNNTSGQCVPDKQGTYRNIHVCQKSCSSPPPPPPYKVGDSVVVETIDGPKDACIINVLDNGKFNTCWNFYNDDTCSEGESNVDISSIMKKIDHNKIACGRNFSQCQGIKTMCGLVIDSDYYPGYDKHSSKSECEKYYGTNNTWGKCTKFSQLFGKPFWSLGCNKDNDCYGDRKCLPDPNPLNQLRKVCSCDKNSECIFNNSGPPNNTSCMRGYENGTTSCPKKWPL